MTIEPNWLSVSQVLLIHDAVIAASGGGTGIRDQGLLDSAISRPQNLFTYENPSLAELAACYAEAIAHNHPFIDGNKRTAFFAAIMFLNENGWDVAAQTDTNHEDMMVNLANHQLSRAEVAAYFEQHSSPLELVPKLTCKEKVEILQPKRSILNLHVSFGTSS
jgi:death-on-curing protein